MRASLVNAKPSATMRAPRSSTMQTKPSAHSGWPSPVMALDSGSDRVVTVIQTRPRSSLKTKFAFASGTPSTAIR